MSTNKNPKRGGISALFLIIALGAGLWGYNYVSLQMPMTQVIASDPRNEGVSVSVHYNNFIDTSALVYDLTGITGEKSRADVFRVFNQYAHEIKDRAFNKVILAHRGQQKFQLDGAYFRQLGAEYGEQNPVFTVRTFPEHLQRPDGSRAFGQWEGGWLGVMKEQMEDFNSFHDQWYLSDAVADNTGGN